MSSPLEQGDLREIDRCLDRGELDQAQVLIARAGENPAYQAGTSYLVTRLLYIKGRLDPERVRQRLTELLAEVPVFPEALTLLTAVGGGMPALQAVDAPAPTAQSNARPSPPPTRPAPPMISAMASAPTELELPSLTPALSSLPSLSAESALSLEPGFVSEPALSSLPTLSSLPLEELPSLEPAPPSRRPVVALGVQRGAGIPTAPRLPTGITVPRPEHWATSSAENPALEREPGKPKEPPPRAKPKGGAAPPNVAPPTSSGSAEPEETSWRSRAFGLAPALVASVPPRSDKARPRQRSGGYSFVAEGGAKGSNPAVRGGADSPSSLPSVANAPGTPRTAREVFAEGARQVIRLTSGHKDVAALAHAGAALLARDASTTWFAPFDFSLYSLERASLALSALTAGEPCDAGSALIAVFGAYVGETIRHCHRGRWSDQSDPMARSVSVGAFTWEPRDLVGLCTALGEPPTLLERLGPGLAPRGSQPWLAHAEPPLERQLWSRVPRGQAMVSLADIVTRSPWARLPGQRFDFTMDSLVRLEPLADALASCAAPLRGSEPWVERLAVLLGAYVGEVVRKEAGGTWESGETGSESSVLRLPSGFEAQPAAALRERIVAQNGVRLAAYARALARK